jgi:Uma2 family endonuclease
MSTIGAALTTWDEFRELPNPRDGWRYELHDGEVIEASPPKPNHVYIQSLLTRWLTAATVGRGWAAQEFPYRPATNLQFWYADVAYLSNEDWQTMRGSDYAVFAPPLIIEVLSPSSRGAEIQRQRIAAFSGGNREFWVVDSEAQTVEVSLPGRASHLYQVNDDVPVNVLPGVLFPVSKIFLD